MRQRCRIAARKNKGTLKTNSLLKTLDYSDGDYGETISYAPIQDVDIYPARSVLFDWIPVANAFGIWEVTSHETLKTNGRWITDFIHNGSEISEISLVTWTQNVVQPFVTRQVATMLVKGTIGFATINWGDKGGILAVNGH